MNQPDPTPETAALTARIAAKKAEPAFRDAAKVLEAPVPLGVVQAQTLREAAAEIAAMDPAARVSRLRRVRTTATASSAACPRSPCPPSSRT